MRSMSRTVLVALATVAASVAMTAAPVSALASPHWLENGVRITESKPFTSEGTVFHLQISSERLNQITVSCSIHGKGTVGAEGTGSLTESSLTNCSITESTGACEKNQPFTIKPLNAPWSMALYNQTGVHIKLGSGGKEPGWKLECTELGTVKVSESCTGLVYGSVSNWTNGEVGEALGGPQFQEPIHCEHGSANLTKQLINDHLKLASGAQLSVSSE
jgi:hypothetical protein